MALVLLTLLLSLRMRGVWRLFGLAVFGVTAFLARTRRAGILARRACNGSRLLRSGADARPRDPAPYRSMFHGGIVHGGQLLGDAFRNRPSDYFGPSSGYGRLFEALNAVQPQPRKVGIIGLGAGVLASYGRKGDEFTFYEISPRVLDIANDEFTFLRDTAAKDSVVLGDGRLSLERVDRSLTFLASTPLRVTRYRCIWSPAKRWRCTCGTWRRTASSSFRRRIATSTCNAGGKAVG